MSAIRRPHLGSARLAVVKLGKQLLTDSTGRLDAGFVTSVAKQVAALRQQNIAVTIVSSGAIGAGRAEMGCTKRPTYRAKLQAGPPVGQRRLMDTWAEAFEPFKLPVAQLLLTREDIDD